MLITANQSAFSLKTKTTTVEINRQLISIGNFTIDSPGEYDVAGVACDVQEIDNHLSALIDAETILFGALDASFEPNDLTEDFAHVSVLFLFINQLEDLTKGANLVSQVEPRLVFYHVNDLVILSQIIKLERLPSPFKVNKQDLVYEGTRHVFLE